ncbi:MAG: PEP-CTERM sorting domain-containing protein, partial [Gemmataceae bacterium]
IFSLKFNGTTVTSVTNRTAELGWSGNVSSFAEDGFGNLYAINYNGTVFQIVPVPEPTTVFGIAAVGLGAVGWIRRRRTRSADHPTPPR